MGKAIIIPGVSFYANNLGRVTFIDTTEYTLKITALENITISFTNDFEYNTKAYPNWQYYVANTQLVILSGTTVSLRGELLPDDDNGGIGTFTISGNCLISGNPLGLVKDNLMRPYEFKGLFKNCTNLEDVGNLELPTTLAEGCYEEMFYGCTSLSVIPRLFATSLEEKCYEKMFYGCSSLDHIVCYNLDDISDYVSDDWLYGVAESGTFEIDYLSNWNATNKASHIPSGWEIDDDHNKPYDAHYFTIDIINGGKFTVLPAREQRNAEFTTDNALSISYKLNAGQWTEVQLIDTGLTLDVNDGDQIRFKGTNTHYCNNTGSTNIHKQWYVIFGCIATALITGCTTVIKNNFVSTTASFNAYGNIMSLIYGDNFIGQKTLTDTFALCELFKCSNIRSAENLILPATTLTASCYRAMFSWAVNTTASPTFNEAIPATECYKYMFEACSNIKKITCLAFSNINTDAFECWTTGIPNNSSVVFIKNYAAMVGNTVNSFTWETYTGTTLPSPTTGNKFGLIGSNWTIESKLVEVPEEELEETPL